jgi:hypothetical protein
MKGSQKSEARRQNGGSTHRRGARILACWVESRLDLFSFGTRPPRLRLLAIALVRIFVISAERTAKDRHRCGDTLIAHGLARHVECHFDGLRRPIDFEFDFGPRRDAMSALE